MKPSVDGMKRGGTNNEPFGDSFNERTRCETRLSTRSEKRALHNDLLGWSLHPLSGPRRKIPESEHRTDRDPEVLFLGTVHFRTHGTKITPAQQCGRLKKLITVILAQKGGNHP